MTSELLDRVHAEIRERRDERRPAVEEYERLQAALAALEGVLSEPAPRALAPAKPAAAKPAAADPKPRRRRAKPVRAPRGANREAVLHAAAERPGATAGELAAASGVSRPVVYNLVKTLSDRGELVKRGTGYALPATPEPVTAAPQPAPEAPEPAPIAVPEPAATTPEPAEPTTSEPPSSPSPGLPRPTEADE